MITEGNGLDLSMKQWETYLDQLEINPDDFNLHFNQFAHQSGIHGLSHVYRTMLNVIQISCLIPDCENGRLAFFGAYIHDMARKHDWLCNEHGFDSARDVLPLYIPLFKKYGTTDSQIEYIRTAVVQHSISETLVRNDPGWMTLAILKDADALDRCRLGDLDERYLRLPESVRIVSAAEMRYARTASWFDECTLVEFIAQCCE